MNKSLDPRINRLGISPAAGEPSIKDHELWPTWEVFHQARRGQHHVHVGSVHAPDSELAIVFAKEQFARRKECVNLWVVKTTDIYAIRYDDSDMFATTPEKLHREAGGYRVGAKIDAYRKKKKP